MTSDREYTIDILGRTLEHLGVQMYKRRDTAIAELVANCWDAGAKRVDITIPDAGSYDRAVSSIVIEDNGRGMTPDEVQDDYLVVGRNQREVYGLVRDNRRVMGRKGIGKLAGFGLASHMKIVTWQEDAAVELDLDLKELKSAKKSTSTVPLLGHIHDRKEVSPKKAHGTRIMLTELKHASAPDEDLLRKSLARRFSRTIRGTMRIFVNGDEVTEPEIELESRFPDAGWATVELGTGQVRYHYGFAAKPIPLAELRGFTIYVNGKTAQAPPFFFNVEGTASGQHGTRYVTGEIEADFLDATIDDESDLISTDRQEIDWEADDVREFRTWGEDLARKVLRDWASRKGTRMQDHLLETYPDLRKRIERLDAPVRGRAERYLRLIGEAEAEPERACDLADHLVRAFEYRHFTDVIEEIEAASADPAEMNKFLANLGQWRVLESRAILEIIEGRLKIIDKFYTLIVNDAPETAHTTGDDNLHDLLGRFPWLIHPEWQTLAEEKTISKQLQEWNDAGVPQDERLRYDFLALTNERRLCVVEIKRSSHAVELKELHRLEDYRDRLSKGDKRELSMVLIHGGALNVNEQTLKMWQERPDAELTPWKDVHARVKSQYEHYRALLKGDVDSTDFDKKTRELASTRQVLTSGSAFRGRDERKKGVGPQDVDYTSDR